MAEPEKSSLLSGSELLQHHTSTYEVNAQFTRLVSTDDLDADRQNDLARMKDDLRRLLAQERVSKSECISEGVWENDNRRVRIIRAEGKWQAFGYEDSSGKYVDSYEALFLMEMNRLFVKWNGVVVSIEQGYSLFLGSHHSSYLTLEEYQVYSLLNRVGYFVLRYDPDRVTYQPEEMDMLSTEERCVWSNLYEMLHQPNPRETFSEKEKHSTMYDTMKPTSLHQRNRIWMKAIALHWSTGSGECSNDLISFVVQLKKNTEETMDRHRMNQFSISPSSYFHLMHKASKSLFLRYRSQGYLCESPRSRCHI
ncbi:hypothetical protein AND_009365 [Anopheles darlingi]|uniref:tRNA-splicing endonuclease subunit Sen54 N-terminal domain-containing protein n=1 Tax=Anopheles darlingi TaxID=43151 RepID=W5J513_ANODA|nr:hypothetical protein AND_009365 [Anopheles darlingi]